jgi:hypothetical protein
MADSSTNTILTHIPRPPAIEWHGEPDHCFAYGVVCAGGLVTRLPWSSSVAPKIAAEMAGQHADAVFAVVPLPHLGPVASRGGSECRSRPDPPTLVTCK